MTSKEQFRALFARFEPAMLVFLDGVREMGIKNLKIYCSVPKVATTQVLKDFAVVIHA